MRMVVLEMPYSDEPEADQAFAASCIVDCLHRAETPIVTHLMYPEEGIMRPAAAHERLAAVSAGLGDRDRVKATVVYVDRGITPGMIEGIMHAHTQDRAIVWRSIGDDLSAHLAEIDEAKRRAGIRTLMVVLDHG